MVAESDSRASLAPALLVAMPQLLDPNFARTVVLLCEHGSNGAFGLVVNRPTETLAAEAVQLTPPPARDAGVHLWRGGPVEPQRGWILLGKRPDGVESVELADGLFLTTSLDVLRAIVEEGWPRTRIFTGYAGWGPGQLDEEFAASAWLIAAIDPRLVFDTPAEEVWEAAIRQLGADPGLLQMGHGVH
jgi:putative transcriptional regulator